MYTDSSKRPTNARHLWWPILLSQPAPTGLLLGIALAAAQDVRLDDAQAVGSAAGDAGQVVRVVVA